MARKLEVVITGDARGLNRALGDAERSTKRFGVSLGTLAKGAAIGAAVGGTALLVKGLKSSVQAAMESEKVQAALAAQMKASGLSFEENAQKIDRNVQALSGLSGFDDEALTEGFTRLVRSTGDVDKSLKAMTLTANIARARNIDLTASADLVGKVMAGNLGVLGRYGIQLEKGTSATEALGILQQRFAGQAEAYGRTTAGAQERVGVAVENLQEKIGAKLLPAFNRLLLWVTAQMPAIEKHVGRAMEVAGRVFRVVAEFIEQRVMPIMRQWWGLTVTAVTAVGNVFNQNGPAIQRILERVGTAVSALAKVMLFLAQNVVVPVLKPLFTTIIPAALTVTIKVLDAVTAAIENMIQAAQWVGNNLGKIFKAVEKAVSPVARALAAAISPIASAIGGIARAMNEVVNGVEAFLSAINRVKSAVGGVAGAVGGVLGKIPGRATGGPVAMGQAYVVGEKGPELFVPGANGTIIPNTSTPSAASGGGGVVNVYLPNYLGSPQEVAQVIRRELIQIGRRNGDILGGLA